MKRFRFNVDYLLPFVPFLLILFLILMAAPAMAAQWEVCWQPPTEFENGYPLLEGDLDFYTLYIDGNELLSFDAVIGTWCYIITINEPGTYVADMTVTHINGRTSQKSNQASFSIGPRTPGAPTNLTVTAL